MTTVAFSKVLPGSVTTRASRIANTFGRKSAAGDAEISRDVRRVEITGSERCNMALFRIRLRYGEATREPAYGWEEVKARDFRIPCWTELTGKPGLI
jgi:hypothetical protein